MIRVVSIHPQRRGFRHHFRVIITGLSSSRARENDSVFVSEEELYNYHRFQIASLTQLGRLCRFPLEDEAESPHQLQMLWNRELASAAWGDVGDGMGNAQSDYDTLQERAARSDQLRASTPPDDDEAPR